MLTRGSCTYSDTRVWGGVITEDSEGKAFQPEGITKVKVTGGNEHGVLKSGDERMMSLEETRSRVWGSHGAHRNGLVALRKGLACILGTLGITHNISRREWIDLNYTVRSYTSSRTMPLYLSSPAQRSSSLWSFLWPSQLDLSNPLSVLSLLGLRLHLINDGFTSLSFH